MRSCGKSFEKAFHVFVQQGVVRDAVGEVRQLLFIGQFAVNKQVRYFKE